MSKNNPECCGCGSYIKYFETVVDNQTILTPYCPVLIGCPSKDKEACKTKPVHNWEHLDCGCVACIDCPIVEDDNCQTGHKQCKDNFHMPHIRKQYSPAESCKECGKK